MNDVKKELSKINKDSVLVEQLANTILTYSDLLPSRNQNYKFEIEKFVDINGKTGIYLQYSQVRAKKILKQYPISNKKITFEKLNSDERSLMFEITKLPYYFFNSLEKMNLITLQIMVLIYVKFLTLFITIIKFFHPKFLIV